MDRTRFLTGWCASCPPLAACIVCLRRVSSSAQSCSQLSSESRSQLKCSKSTQSGKNADQQRYHDHRTFVAYSHLLQSAVPWKEVLVDVVELSTCLVWGLIAYIPLSMEQEIQAEKEPEARTRQWHKNHPNEKLVCLELARVEDREGCSRWSYDAEPDVNETQLPGLADQYPWSRSQLAAVASRRVVQPIQQLVRLGWAAESTPLQKLRILVHLVSTLLGPSALCGRQPSSDVFRHVPKDCHGVVRCMLPSTSPRVLSPHRISGAGYLQLCLQQEKWVAGQRQTPGVFVYAHQVICCAIRGAKPTDPVSPYREVLHSCRRWKHCLNPHHLTWGTKWANRRDSLRFHKNQHRSLQTGRFLKPQPQ